MVQVTMAKLEGPSRKKYIRLLHCPDDEVVRKFDVLAGRVRGADAVWQLTRDDDDRRRGQRIRERLVAAGIPDPLAPKPNTEEEVKR